MNKFVPNKLLKIKLFTLSQIYNLYFLIIIGKTFNNLLKKQVNYESNHVHDLRFQKKHQSDKKNQIFNIAKSYIQFESVVLFDKNGDQNVEKPITKQFYRDNPFLYTNNNIWNKQHQHPVLLGNHLK